MTLYEEFEAAKDARLLKQTPMPIHVKQRRKGLRRTISVQEVVAVRQANGIEGELSERMVRAIDGGELQVEHRFKPQDKAKRYPRSKQELLLQFRQHGRSANDQ